MSSKAASELGFQGRKHPSNQDNTRTSKSWKSLARDRFKHSAAGGNIPISRHGSLTLRKQGGGGKFTAGKVIQSEDEEQQLDPHDPNYDPEEVEGISSNHFQPSAHSLQQFSSAFQDYLRFKDHVLNELPRYLSNSGDWVRSAQRMAESLKDLDLQDYHYDLVYTLIRWDIEQEGAGKKTQQDRITKLIKYLHDHNGCVMTPAQIDLGVRKLYNTLDDLLLEFPHARQMLHNYALALESAGITENTWQDELDELEKEAALLKDQKTDKELHNKINKMLESYLRSEDLDQLASQIEKLNSPQLHFELVKCAMLMALTRGRNKDSELINEMLAAFTGELIGYEAAQEGILHFMENMEEYEEHYTNILCFLSCFVARCVADHVFPIELLSCPDMQQRKLAGLVMAQTKHLLNGKGAAAKLQKVWTLSEASFSPARKPARSLSASSSSSASPLSLGSRKVSDSASPAQDKGKIAPTARKMSAGGANPFEGFVIGAKKPGTAAYELEQTKKASPASQTKELNKDANKDEHTAEKERLDAFGYYDASASRQAKNTPFAQRSRMF